MKTNFKKLGAIILSGAILFAFASCGKDEATYETTTASTTESTTVLETTTVPTETTTTETTQKETQAKKPTEAKPKPTEAKTKPAPKPTEAPKPQKETPKFVFSQTLPVKVVAFDAQFEVINAAVVSGYWSDDTYIFDIRVSMRRCDDGIEGKSNSAVRMTIKDSNGNVVRKTSMGAGNLGVGEEGYGLIAWSVDAPGTYTIEFSSI